jgi:uncharacterized surface protein with fasciclin (FAS1) repeats
MTTMRRLSLVAASALLAFAVAAPVAAAQPHRTTIVDAVLAADGEFDVLQAAVVEAGLVGALDGKRQFTVFVPTDAGFVSTFSGLLGTSLTEAQVIDFVAAGGVDGAFGDGALASILLYHVAPGERWASDVLASTRIRTLNGDFATPSLVGGMAYIDEARILAADVDVSNGVIHVIDRVIFPG